MAALTVIATLVLRDSIFSQNLQGRLIYQNRRVQQVNGWMQVNAMWEEWLHEYDLTNIPLRRPDWQYLQTLHRLTRGGAYGFLVTDPTDSQAVSSATDSTSSGVVTGLGSNTFQLYKRYTDVASALYDDRKITRPNSIQVYVSGVLKTLGVDYTLDTTTGILTIPSNPSAAAVTWTGSFYVPVHFANDAIDWTNVGGSPDPDGRLISGPAVTLIEVRE